MAESLNATKAGSESQPHRGKAAFSETVERVSPAIKTFRRSYDTAENVVRVLNRGVNPLL